MPQSKFEHVKVAGLLTVVPQNEICIYDEAQYYNNNVKKIDRMRKIVGFWKRRVADIGTTPSDLAIDAAKKLFEQSGIDKKTIDVLIFVVQKPDVINPATAFYIHRELDLPKSCMSFDINQGCPGWVYGMHVAHAMVESKACKRVLLLAGDTPAEYTDPKDREKAPLFGDSATATILEYSEEKLPATYFDLGSDGSGFESLLRPAGGERIKIFDKSSRFYDEGDGLFDIFEKGDRKVCLASARYMDGLAIFDFTMNVVPDKIKALMQYAGIAEADIPYFMCHQANKQIVQTVAQHIGFPLEKASYEAFENYGNQTMNSIPSLICMKYKENFGEPVKILCASFGNGLSWASCVITIGGKGTFCGGVQTFEKPKNFKTRRELISYWKNKILGDEHE